MEWIEAAAVVRFDAIKGQELVCIEPDDHGLSDAVLEDITVLSMPDCLEPTHNQRCQYVFRVLDKDKKKYYSAFCAFIRVVDKGNPRGYFTQAVILVHSDDQKHAGCAIFYKSLCSKLSDVLIGLPMANSTSNKGKSVESSSDVIDFTDGGLSNLQLALSPSKSSSVETTREVLLAALQQMADWEVGDRVPFFGEVFIVHSDDLACATTHQGSASSMEPLSPPLIHSFLQTLDPSLGEGVRGGVSSTSAHELRLRANVDRCMSVEGVMAGLTDSAGGLYAHQIAPVLHRLGLVPHLWSLWELLIRGNRIAVFSPNAAVVSACVCSLANLVAPLPYSGHCRPYLRLDDSDVDDLCATSQPALVGVTNPFLISRSFAAYDAVLFLPNPDKCFAEPVLDQAVTADTNGNAPGEAPTSAHTCLGVGLGGRGHIRAAEVGPGYFYRCPPLSGSGSENKVDEGYMHAAITINMKVLDPAQTSKSRKADGSRLVERAFDQWSGQGGLIGKNGGLLCLKYEVGTSLVARPDTQVLAMVLDFFKAEAVESQKWLKKRSDEEKKQGGKSHAEVTGDNIDKSEDEVSVSRGSEAMRVSRPMVMADMLLREHFRLNTVAACAPLRRYLEWRHLPGINTIISSLELEKPLRSGEEGAESLRRLADATAAVSGLLVDRLRASGKEMVQAAIVDYVKANKASSSSNKNRKGAAGGEQPSVGTSAFTKANQPEPVRRILAAFHGGLWQELTMSPSRKEDSLNFMSALAHGEHFQTWFRLQADYTGLLAVAEAVHTGALLRSALP